MKAISHIPKQIRPFLIRHTYEKGEYIFTAGSENLNMYIIESGSCTANMENYNGTMAFIGSYHSGDIFGELEIFCKDLKTVEVIAVKKSTVYIIHKKYLLEWMKLDFDFALELIEYLAEDLRYHSKTAALLHMCSVKERVAYSILAYADASALDVLTKKNISSLAKTPIRSVNRALASLIECGCIQITGKQIHILNRPFLEEISNYNTMLQL